MPSQNIDTPPVILSEGAGVALGNVFNRLVNPSQPKTTGKRPRSSKSPVVLAESEELHESLIAEQEERRKSREVKRARQTFETNALIVPDAATGAALEKELLVTATKGAVVLFNAVAKAQKGRGGRAGKGGKGEMVSKDSFMSMMRAGVGKKAEAGERKAGDELSDGEDEEEQGGGAKWLRNDYLTARSKTLRDWDKEVATEVNSSDEEESEQVGDAGRAESSEGENGSDSDESGSNESNSDKSNLNSQP